MAEVEEAAVEAAEEDAAADGIVSTAESVAEPAFALESESRVI